MRIVGYDDDFSRVAGREAAIHVELGSVPGWQVIGLDARTRTIRIPAGVELDLGSSGKALASTLPPRLRVMRRPTAGSWSVWVGTSRPRAEPRTAVGGSSPARTARPLPTPRARSSRSDRVRWRPRARRCVAGELSTVPTGTTSSTLGRVPRSRGRGGPSRSSPTPASRRTPRRQRPSSSASKVLDPTRGGRPGGTDGRHGRARRARRWLARARDRGRETRLMFDQILWFSTRGAGIVSLLLSTIVVCMGFATVARWQAPGWPRFLTVERCTGRSRCFRSCSSRSTLSRPSSIRSPLSASSRPSCRSPRAIGQWRSPLASSRWTCFLPSSSPASSVNGSAIVFGARCTGLRGRRGRWPSSIA